jgi:tetratricopeptide (TPR) repeat protein
MLSGSRLFMATALLACACGATLARAQDPDLPQPAPRESDAPLAGDALHGAEAAVRGRRFEEAVRIATAAIRSGRLTPPRLARAQSLRGAAFLGLKRYRQAHADFEAALAAEPRNPVGLIGRGVALLGLGRPADAFADFDRALKWRRVPAFYFWRGLARLQLRDFGAAVGDFDAALALRPRYALAYFGRGLAHHAAGQSVSARDDYERALAIAPTLSEARQALAALRAGRPAPAVPPAPEGAGREGVIQF